MLIKGMGIDNDYIAIDGQTISISIGSQWCNQQDMSMKNTMII